MKATFDTTTVSDGREPIALAETLSIAELIALHGAEIEKLDKARAGYRHRQWTNRLFDSAALILVVCTGIACMASLLTMTVR